MTWGTIATIVGVVTLATVGVLTILGIHRRPDVWEQLDPMASFGMVVVSAGTVLLPTLGYGALGIIGTGVVFTLAGVIRGRRAR